MSGLELPGRFERRWLGCLLAQLPSGKRKKAHDVDAWAFQFSAVEGQQSETAFEFAGPVQWDNWVPDQSFFQARSIYGARGQRSHAFRIR